MISITRLSSGQADFLPRLDKLLQFDAATDASIERTVAAILADVRARGDAAVLEYTNRFDRMSATSMAALTLPKSRLDEALVGLEPERRQALEAAAERVRRYHEKQLQASWSYTEADGTLLGQQVTALDRVGLYVPGGKAAYPSSVLMNAIPAKVAGVAELIMVVPTPGGEQNELVLAAAAIAGVDKVFTIGGAQAVAAMAYGTDSVPQVDKIVGPGNAYVAEAKRRVFGTVGIDMIAGPSEILVICDGQTNPDWIAMDLFSQAEHDELAQSILLTPDAAFADKVEQSIKKLVGEMPRNEVITASISNRIAPEHLELSVEDPVAMTSKIRHAGAIFMGRNTCEALGDYCAGPNHVLPTSRTARFSSPLGVYDFQKRSSLIMVSEKGAQTLGRIAATLAYGEGLQAHARSAEYRLHR